MKDLKQIILCSQTDGYSYIRNIRVTAEYVTVTSIEKLPFRYHEFLLRKRKRKDCETQITVPYRGNAHLLDCAYCGNKKTYQCDRCGYYSCMTANANEHYCPGCQKTYMTRPATSTHASNSGFVGTNLFGGNGDIWNRAQSALADFIQHRNQQSD